LQRPALRLVVAHHTLGKAAQMGDEGTPIGQAARADALGDRVSHDLLGPAAADAKQEFGFQSQQ